VRSVFRKIPILFVIIFSCVLLGADGGAVRDERASLEEQRAALQKKITVLKREQDFLLFQESMYGGDSKYLIINIAKRTAQLKYKNRLLKDVRFTASKKFPHGLQPGMLVLTKKDEGKNDQHALVFGTSLIVQWKRTSVPPGESGIPFITLPKKEMQSLYYAVEEGALAYIIR
jgi:hypothetical protein